MKAYQCKVSIKDSKPLVWWRVFIPAGISFSALSLLLEELTGEELGDGFSFEIYRDSRAWELSESQPLGANYYYDAYSAAHTPISTLFEKGRPLYVRGADKPLKIEVEKQDGAYPLSYPLLVRMRADMDVQELFGRLKSRFVVVEETGPALRRTEFLNLAKDGALTLHCIESAPIRGETYQPSGSSVLLELSSRLRTSIEESLKQPWRMRSLLLKYSGNDLQDLAQEYGIPDIEKKERETLADELCSLLLKPEAVREAFLILPDDEIRAFEAAIAEEGPHRLREEEEHLFDTLIDKGYVFMDEPGTMISIPVELPVLYRLIETPEFNKTRRQLDWIIRCMNDIVPPYYAIMPMQKFCRLCRRAGDPQIRPEEVPALLRELPAGITECVVRDDEICSENLAEDRETYDYVVAVQGDKPWHIMRENEISELLTYGYPPHDPSYQSFKAYLQNHFRLDGKQIEKITRKIHLLSAYNHKMQDFFKVLDSFHLKLTRRQTEEMSKLFQNVMNNTPTFYNRGFAPAQMAERK